jgi:hypothetical protein
VILMSCHVSRPPPTIPIPIPTSVSGCCSAETILKFASFV